MSHRTSLLRGALAAAALTLSAAALQAQAANYPAFELPTIETRAFNFAVADGDDFGTQLLFQWREGMSPRMQLGLDAGFGDPDAQGADSYFFIGGSLGYQLMSGGADLPFDLMLATGLNLAHTDNLSIFRIPVGVSAGRRFPLERQMAITPFVHPRLIIDHCSEVCMAGGDETGFGLGFDLGVNFEFTQAAAVRLALSFANGEVFEDQDAIGFGFVWHPAGSRR